MTADAVMAEVRRVAGREGKSLGQVVSEFYASDRSAQIFDRPLDPARALDNIGRVLRLPHVRTPGEPEGLWKTYSEITEGVVVRGNLVPDAHIVALMRRFGVETIWTRDSDYRKFRGIRVENPFDEFD